MRLSARLSLRPAARFVGWFVQIQVRLQRPTVVAEVGFMLSVTKFFVPGFTMSGVSLVPFESNDVVLEGELSSHRILLSASCTGGSAGPA